MQERGVMLQDTSAMKKAGGKLLIISCVIKVIDKLILFFSEWCEGFDEHHYAAEKALQSSLYVSTY